MAARPVDADHPVRTSLFGTSRLGAVGAYVQRNDSWESAAMSMVSRSRTPLFLSRWALTLLLLGLPLGLWAQPENRHIRTVAQGRIFRASPVRGKAVEHAPQIYPWTLDLNPHPNPGAARNARIISLDCPSMRNIQSKPRVDGPGDTVRFEAAVRWDGNGDPPFGVALHTNANLPGVGRFDEYSMKLERREGQMLHYSVELPIFSAANYRAKAVLVKDGKVAVPGADAWSPGGDYEFRPYFREHDRIREVLVNVANIGPGKYGTFEDMIGDERIPNSRGKYTLAQMEADGTTAVRLLPFASSNNSPYSKTSFFDVMVDYSAPAMDVRKQVNAALSAPNPDMGRVDYLRSRMYTEAVKSFSRFANEAHQRGIRIFADYIANHTGPEVRMLDAFFYERNGGAPMDIFDLKRDAGFFALRENDPSVTAVNAQHQREIVGRLDLNAWEHRPLSLQRTTSQLFAKYNDPQGAQRMEEIADGGFFEWPKPGTWQLNHGRHRTGYNWYDLPQSPESRSLRGMVSRDMAFWVLLGVDGFRLDHLTGMPKVFVEEDLAKIQGVANKYRPGVQVFLNGEDFHTSNYTANKMDALERGAFRAITGAQNPAQLQQTYDAAWVASSPKDVGNHDEGGAIARFGGNTAALGRILALNALVGGPDSRKMLDAFAEAHPIDHRNLSHKPYALFNATDAMRQTASVDARAGIAKRYVPALWERQRHWLKLRDGSAHGLIFAAARFRDRNDHQLALVFSNFHGEQWQNGRFNLTDEAKARLWDGAMYQAYNPMGDWRPQWSAPMSGREIKDQGVYVSLKPNETQVLDIREVVRSGDGWVSKGRDEHDWLTVGGALSFD